MTPEEIEKIVAAHVEKQGSIIAILEDIQKQCRYLSEEALRIVARCTGRSLVDIYGVATFYKAFSLKPNGKHCDLRMPGNRLPCPGSPGHC